MVPEMFPDKFKRITIMATRPMKFAEREAAEAKRLSMNSPKNILRRGRRAWRSGNTEEAKSLFARYTRVTGKKVHNRGSSTQR